MEDLRALWREVDRDRHQLGAARSVPSVPADGDEEVEQHRLVALVDEHVAPRAEAGQRALGHERGQNRGHGRVDGVAALAQDPRRPPRRSADARLRRPLGSRREPTPRVRGKLFSRAGTRGRRRPRSRGRDSKLLAVPGAAVVRPAKPCAGWCRPRGARRCVLPSLRRPRPSKRVAMTVTQTWSAERLVDVGAEDDVGVGVRGLLDHLGRLADLDQRQVRAARDREQDRARAVDRGLEQRRGHGASRRRSWRGCRPCPCRCRAAHGRRRAWSCARRRSRG